VDTNFHVPASRRMRIRPGSMIENGPAGPDLQHSGAIPQEFRHRRAASRRIGLSPGRRLSPGLLMAAAPLAPADGDR